MSEVCNFVVVDGSTYVHYNVKIEAIKVHRVKVRTMVDTLITGMQFSRPFRGVCTHELIFCLLKLHKLSLQFGDAVLPPVGMVIPQDYCQKPKSQQMLWD
jgi:hypothetical protein